MSFINALKRNLTSKISQTVGNMTRHLTGAVAEPLQKAKIAELNLRRDFITEQIEGIFNEMHGTYTLYSGDWYKVESHFRRFATSRLELIREIFRHFLAIQGRPDTIPKPRSRPLKNEINKNIEFLIKIYCAPTEVGYELFNSDNSNRLGDFYTETCQLDADEREKGEIQVRKAVSFKDYQKRERMARSRARSRTPPPRRKSRSRTPPRRKSRSRTPTPQRKSRSRSSRSRSR